MGRKKLNNINIVDNPKNLDAIIQTPMNNDTNDIKSNETNETNTSNSTENNSKSTNDLSNSDDIIDINELRGKEIYHYKMLDNFFSSCDIAQIERMIDIINGNHLISLRFLDWFVTRYCYLYKLSINVANKYTKENNFNINISYKAQLKSFKKKYFDPFRRKKKFYFTTDNNINKNSNKDTPAKNNIILLTTLGQLNFFRWAITYDLINYTETNYRSIITKIEHVNSYFRKNSVIDNMLANKNKSILIKTSSDNSTNSINSNDSTNSSESNELIESNKTDKDIVNSIYNLNKKSNIIIENTNNKKKTSEYKLPQVCRNIMLEL